MVISLTGLSWWNVERTAIDNINSIFDFTLSQTRPSNWISHLLLRLLFLLNETRRQNTKHTIVKKHIVTVWIQQANCHLILCFVLNDSRCSLFVVFFFLVIYDLSRNILTVLWARRGKHNKCNRIPQKANAPNCFAFQLCSSYHIIHSLAAFFLGTILNYIWFTHKTCMQVIQIESQSVKHSYMCTHIIYDLAQDSDSICSTKIR